MNNRDSWLPIIEFLDDQHESYMLQEQQPRRIDKIDLRVHACLYFIRPTGHTLKPLDIEVMKRLSSRVNLIPVVAKADTLSPADLVKYKQRVSCPWNGVPVYSANCSRFVQLSRRKESRSIHHLLRRMMRPLLSTPEVSWQLCPSLLSDLRRMSRLAMAVLSRVANTRGVLRKSRMRTIAISRNCDPS